MNVDVQGEVISRSPGDAWDPERYHRFSRQRRRPFFDLLRGVERRPGMRVLDLGCGTGELTAVLARALPGSDVTGIDASPRMLERARVHAGARLVFREQRVEAVEDWRAWDLVFSNAALQWVEGHEAFFHRLLAELKPGAQLAVQMPDNDAHPSHALARELAREAPFAEALGGFVRTSPVLPLERYAELLHAHGLEPARCEARVYGHVLDSTASVLEWTRGTTLVPYLARLSPEDGAAFLEAYRTRLLAVLGDRRPYFYPFRRIFLWGQRARRGRPSDGNG